MQFQLFTCMYSDSKASPYHYSSLSKFIWLFSKMFASLCFDVFPLSGNLCEVKNEITLNLNSNFESLWFYYIKSFHQEMWKTFSKNG